MPRWPNSKLCGARKTDGSGETCKHPAGWGTDHNGIGACRKHGGTLPNHRRKAQVIKAQDAVVAFGLPRNINPVKAILEETQRTAGHVAWLGQQVASLKSDDLVRGITRVQVLPDGSKATTVEAAVNVWVKLYQEERRHLVAVCKAGIDIGLKEIEIHIAKKQGELLAQVITAILGDLSLTKRQEELVSKVVPKHLQAVAVMVQDDDEKETEGYGE